MEDICQSINEKHFETGSFVSMLVGCSIYSRCRQTNNGSTVLLPVYIVDTRNKLIANVVTHVVDTSDYFLWFDYLWPVSMIPVKWFFIICVNNTSDQMITCVKDVNNFHMSMSSHPCSLSSLFCSFTSHSFSLSSHSFLLYRIYC